MIKNSRKESDSLDIITNCKFNISIVPYEDTMSVKVSCQNEVFTKVVSLEDYTKNSRGQQFIDSTVFSALKYFTEVRRLEL